MLASADAWDQNLLPASPTPGDFAMDRKNLK